MERRSYLFASMLWGGMIFSGPCVFSQDRERTELKNTEQLSKQYPDSAFLLLKEIYSKAIEKKDRIGTGICLQQMGQICYYLGSYPRALEYHLQADRIFKDENKSELVAANLDDMGLVYYYNRQIPVAYKQYCEAQAIYNKLGNKEGLGNTMDGSGIFMKSSRNMTAPFSFSASPFRSTVR